MSTAATLSVSPAPAPASAAPTAATTSSAPDLASRVHYAGYTGERQLGAIMALVDRDLSEPYSIFTYRYFLSGWPELCVLAYGTADEKAQESGAAPLLGVVVGKADTGEGEPGMALPAESSSRVLTGYIAMLAVETSWRRAGIGRELVRRALERMQAMGCQEVALETEVCNTAALGLYERLGFAREERLLRYYLNGGDAFRLKLWLVSQDGGEEEGDDVDLAVGQEEQENGAGSADANSSTSER